MFRPDDDSGSASSGTTTTTADVTLNSGTVSVSGTVKAVEDSVATPAPNAIVVFSARDPLSPNYITAGAAITVTVR